MLARLGVEHIHTSVAHPSANGAAERLVQSMKSLLSRHINDHPNAWLAALPHIRMAYMSRVHAATGATPFEMLTGYRVRMPNPVQQVFASAVASPAQHIQRVQDSLSALDKHALAGIGRQFQDNLRRFERRRKRGIAHRSGGDLSVGDYVLELSDSALPLCAEARGPYRITAFKNRRSVAVLLTGGTGFREQVTFDRHVSRLARYYTRRCV
jgi:hypothetical protein